MKLKVNKDNEAVTCQLQQHNKGTKNEKNIIAQIANTIMLIILYTYDFFVVSTKV